MLSLEVVSAKRSLRSLCGDSELGAHLAVLLLHDVELGGGVGDFLFHILEARFKSILLLSQTHVHSIWPSWRRCLWRDRDLREEC